MSRLFYRVARDAARPAFWTASRARVLHAERVPRKGAFLLVANHESVFDPALLTLSTPRVVHWVASREIFQRPFPRWFYTAMLACPLDRSRPDPGAIRAILRDLRAGQAVGIFPEGRVRGSASVAEIGGRMPETLARLVEVAKVPVVPCVVLGGRKFTRWPSWLPLRRTRWAAAYGEPLALRPDLEPAAARQALLDDLARALPALGEEARPHA